MKHIKTVIASLPAMLLFVGVAHAGLGDLIGGIVPVPEIDGAAGLSAMALVACVAAIAYSKLGR